MKPAGCTRIAVRDLLSVERVPEKSSCHANLLGGPAVRYELHGLTASEIGRDFDLNRMLIHGYLPTMYSSDTPQRLLNAYVCGYLKEKGQRKD